MRVCTEIEKVILAANFFVNYAIENGFTEAAVYQNGELIPICEVLQWLRSFREMFLK